MKNTMIIVAVSLLAVLFASAVYIFVPNNKVINAYPGKVTGLVIEGNNIETDVPVIQDNQVLLSFDTVKKYFDKDLFWDKDLKKIIITSSDKVVTMDTQKDNAEENGAVVKLKINAQMIDGKVYMPIEFLSDVYKIDVEYSKKNNLIVIDYRESIKRQGEVLRRYLGVRKEMTVKSPIFEIVKRGDKFWVFDEYENWYKVRTEDGIVGFVQKKYVKVVALISSTTSLESQTPAADLLRGKLNVAWNAVYNKPINVNSISKIEGLDVVAPTWFEVDNTSGALKSKADRNYVSWAHQNGYKVWAVLSSMKPEITSEILNDYNKRKTVIDKITNLALTYKIDGINVDFENMYLKDKDMFSQFIRELAPLLRRNGLTISVDVGVPGGSDNFSKCYDRKSLAESADYIMVMTYDQHWSSSRVSGSVAELDWVEDSIKKTLEEVPAKKLLLGLPFYMRVWKEMKEPSGDVKVIGSEVLSMEGAVKVINKNHAKVSWNEESGQFYVEYNKGKITYKMWIEDKNSINLKASLAQKYRLAGTAAWCLGFESENVWSVLDTILKKDLNYIEWKQANETKKYKFD